MQPNYNITFMKKLFTVQTALIVILLLTAGWLWSRVSTLEDSLAELQQPDLYSVMNNMQQQTHKLYYAIEAENAELTDFYLHELEEAAEELIDANLYYHDQPVGMLTETMLEPVIEDLEETLDAGHWEQLREKRAILVGACNNCHGTTGYGTIRITEKGEVNPFNQNFDVLE